MQTGGNIGPEFHDAELVIGPVYGWRVWQLFLSEPDWNVLRSINGLFPCRWPHKKPLHAVCIHDLHQAPHHGCECGIYAHKEPIDVISVPRKRWSWYDGHTCVGAVALWGRIIEHEHGYRGEYAYTTKLTFVAAKRRHPSLTLERCLEIADGLATAYGVECRFVEIDSIGGISIDYLALQGGGE